jgi:hypothetical protein
MELSWMQLLFPLSVLQATNFYVAVFLRNGMGTIELLREFLLSFAMPHHVHKSNPYLLI